MSRLILVATYAHTQIYIRVCAVSLMNFFLVYKTLNES